MFTMLVFAIALQAEAVAQPGQEPSAPPAPITLTADAFIKPSQQRLQEALAQHLSPGLAGGSATIECKVAAEGQLADCKGLTESPQGAGVGRGVLAMVRLFRLPPALPDGQKVEGGTVRVPVKFGRQ